MARLILVHGAFCSSNVWGSRVVHELEKLGHSLEILDLPSHGRDSTPKADVTLDLYAEFVAAKAMSRPEPAVLIGHSMGGLVITQAADNVLAAGGTCVMVSINWVGFAGVEHLRRHGRLPIHGHRNGWGAFTRHPLLGFSFQAYQKLWRLAGLDQLHVNGIRSKFWESDASVVASAQSCLSEWAGVPGVMPVFSSGQWANQAPDMYATLHSTDLMHLAGGGIIGHPDGIAAGVASMRESWEAAATGVPLERYAQTHPALKRALEHFGQL